MVKNSNLDLISLFKEYDIDNDGYINGSEFISMIQVFDNSLTDSEL